MGIEILISDLKERYTYSHKLLNALRKIIPAMIEYYGNFTSPIIYRALLSCEIILCDSYETISLLMSNRNKLEPNNIIKKDLKNLSSYYYSYPYIKYDSLLSSYVIDKIDRKIFVSPAHNIESPKGLSSLTRAIIAILRSYVKEYQLVDDTLIKNICLNFV